MSESPSNFQDPNYLKYKEMTDLINQVYQGTHSSLSLINKFPMEAEDTLKSRRKEANLDNYVFSTTQSIKNIIFRKPINTDEITNDTLLEWLETVNLKDDINTFAKNVLVNRIKDGKTYILVESPTAPGNMSQAEQEAQGIRPYMNIVLRSQVPFIEYDDNMNIIVFPIIETYQEKEGRFGWVEKQRIRTYELVDGIVKHSLWYEDKEEPQPDINIPMIPVVELGEDIVPPLYDLTKININHFNRESEKSSYVRVGAAPFPQIWGAIRDEGGNITLSVNEGLEFNGTKNETGFEWAEMSGNNYDMIQKEIKHKQEQMERISVEFTSQVQNITATEVEKASTANESKLTDYATELEKALNKAIEFMGMFNAAVAGDYKVIVNKDFDSTLLTPEQINVLLQLRASGDLSWEELRFALEKGEVLRLLNEKERETERTRLRNDLGEL